jgi:hypothetical protein
VTPAPGPGEVVGTPEETAATPQSYTGQYLKQALERRGSGKAERAAGAPAVIAFHMWLSSYAPDGDRLVV